MGMQGGFTKELVLYKMEAFLNRLVSDHGSIDLDWLRDVPPDKAKYRRYSVKEIEDATDNFAEHLKEYFTSQLCRIFHSNTFTSGKIESNTIDECRDAYSIWMENTHELVKQKSLVKPASGVSSAGVNPSLNAIPNVVDERVMCIEMQVMCYQLHIFLESYWRDFLLYTKSQNRFPLILVIASISILILMQVSIIVLLARPPQVHVISQMDYMNSFGNNDSPKFTG